jgi:phage shock protein C
MYCTNCGTQTGDPDKFCRECGHQTPAGRDARQQSTPAGSAPQRLYRAMWDKKIAGVCSGFAQYLDVDVTLVRLSVVAGTLFSGGLGLLAYIAAWIIMPSDRYARPFPSASGASPHTAS